MREYLKHFVHIETHYVAQNYYLKEAFCSKTASSNKPNIKGWTQDFKLAGVKVKKKKKNL